MTKTTVRVTNNGRAQIPYDVRVSLGISIGDQLVIEILEIIHPGQGEIVRKEAFIGKLKKGSASDPAERLQKMGAVA
jgi:bifunctional DNA-binding transcriptional regulator/antitoxin component of YhaV-PrlF toxin-antitoxin module